MPGPCRREGYSDEREGQRDSYLSPLSDMEPYLKGLSPETESKACTHTGISRNVIQSIPLFPQTERCPIVQRVNTKVRQMVGDSHTWNTLQEEYKQEA